jgi:hypothetical protein
MFVRKLFDIQQLKMSNLMSLVFSSIVTGLIIGYYKQKLADSGDIYIGKIFKSIVIAVLSYLLAIFLPVFVSKKYKNINYIWLALLGSAFCSLFLNVIKYLVDNWRFRKSASIIDYVSGQLSDSIIGFILSFPVYSITSLLVFSAVYFIDKRLSKPSQ